MRLLLSVALGGVVSRFAFVGLFGLSIFEVSSPFSGLLLLLSQNTLLRARERERERETKKESPFSFRSPLVLFSSEADDVNDDDNERERESIDI